MYLALPEANTFRWPVLIGLWGFPGIALFWHVRRVAVATGAWPIAFRAVITYAGFVIAGVLALFCTQLLSAATALGAMAAAGVLGGVVGWRRLGLALPPAPLVHACAHSSLRYARYGLLAGGLSWVPGQSVTLGLGFLSGAEQVGLYKSFILLLQPGWQTITATTTRLWGEVAKSGSAAQSAWFRHGAALVVCSLVYGVGAGVVGPWVLPRILGEGFTLDVAPWVSGLVMAGVAAASTLTAVMRGLLRSGRILVGYALSTVVVVVGVLLMVPHYGVNGALLVQAVAFLASTFPMGFAALGMKEALEDAPFQRRENGGMYG